MVDKKHRYIESDVVIKNVPCPKRGYPLHITLMPNGRASIGSNLIERDYSILPPHGRLGDLDILEENTFDDGSYLLIHNAPTVLEASK